MKMYANPIKNNLLIDFLEFYHPPGGRCLTARMVNTDDVGKEHNHFPNKYLSPFVSAIGTMLT